MANARSEMVDACIAMREQGMDLSHIRKNLESIGVEANEIKVIMGLVDSHDRNRAMQKAKAIKRREVFFVGVVLLVAGIIMTFVTLGTSTVILFYGAVIGGLSMMGYGYSGLKK